MDNPAVLALLKGKALREVEEERNRRFWRNWPVGKGFKDFDGGPSMLVVKGMRGEDVHRFAVSRRKITVAQYNQCVEEGACEAAPSSSGDGDSIREESSEDNGERVADVSWEAQQRYARWMRQKTGHAYRTMAQDEFSGRGLPEPTNPFGLRLLAVPEGFSPERSWQQRWKRYSAAKASGYGTGLWNPWLDYLEPADPALRLKGLSEALERFVEESRGFWVARPLAP